MDKNYKEIILKKLCKKQFLDYETENSGTLELMWDCYNAGYKNGVIDKTTYIENHYQLYPLEEKHEQNN